MFSLATGTNGVIIVDGTRVGVGRIVTGTTLVESGGPADDVGI